MARAPMGRGGQAGVPGFELAALPQAPSQQDTRMALEAAGARVPVGLAQRVDQLLARRQDRADQAAADEAAIAGAGAGDADPGVEMDGGGDIYRRAWQRAADEAGGRRLQIAARDRLDELAREHEADPEAFAAASAAYRDGVASGLPDRLRPAFGQSFDTLAQPYVSQLRTLAQRRAADEALASFNDLMPRRLASIERLAGQAEGGDQAAVRALTQEREGLIADLARLGPRSGFTLGGREFPADATRSGARSVAQLQELLAQVEARRVEAATLAAWRAAGGGEAWIARWLAGQTGAAGAGGAPAPAGPGVVDRIFRAENPAGDARRNGMGSSASGPGQITDPTWRHYAGRLGLAAEQRNDPAAHRAIFAAYMEDARQRIGRPLTDAETYAAWGLGIDGLAAFLRAGPEADALTIYRQAAGRDLADLAFRQNPGLLVPGMTVGQVLAEFGRRIGAQAGDAPPVRPVAPADQLPLDQVRRIERLMRSELADQLRVQREAQAAARAELEPRVRENRAALVESGRPVHTITDEQLRSAGMDEAAIGRHRAAERAAQFGFQAEQELRSADTPEKIQAVLDRFAPGTELFAADPALASRILDRARQRGVQVRGAALAQRVADLTAEAQASGEARSITREEAEAAGLRPEEVDRINRDLAKAAELGKIAREGGSMSPADRDETRRRLQIAGDQAAENRARLEAYERAWQQQAEALDRDPAAWAMRGSRTAQDLARRVAGGEVAALPQLIDVLAAEQARMAVADDKRRSLPKDMAGAIVANIQQLPSAGERLQRVRAMLDQLPDARQRQQVLAALGEAGLSEGVRIAAGAVARIGQARAARLADELDTEARQLNVPAGLRQQANDQVTAFFQGTAGIFGGQDGLGALRAAQYAATGQAGMLRNAEEHRDRLTRLVLVRAVGNGGTATGEMARQAYADLFGGLVVVREPGRAVLVTAPAGTDPDELVRGLAALRGREAARLFPEQTPGHAAARRALEAGAVWIDAGAGFALWHAGQYVPGADGRPIIVDSAAAIAAGRLAARAPEPGAPPRRIRETMPPPGQAQDVDAIGRAARGERRAPEP